MSSLPWIAQLRRHSGAFLSGKYFEPLWEQYVRVAMIPIATHRDPINTDLSLHPRQAVPQARLTTSAFGTSCHFAALRNSVAMGHSGH